MVGVAFGACVKRFDDLPAVCALFSTLIPDPSIVILGLVPRTHPSNGWYARWKAVCCGGWFYLMRCPRREMGPRNECEDDKWWGRCLGIESLVGWVKLPPCSATQHFTFQPKLLGRVALIHLRLIVCYRVSA